MAIEVSTITIPAGSVNVPLAAVRNDVFVKTLWSDSWELVPDLFCEEAVLVAAPSISTATIKWHYGRIVPTGSSGFREVLKKSYNRVYVKVVYRTLAPPQRTWYGVIEVDEDLMGGEVVESDGNRLASGEQTFTAYGFEHLLDQQFINSAKWDDGGEIRDVPRALTFNREGKENRTLAQSGGVHHFAENREQAEFWSSRDIFEYLWEYHTPQSLDGMERLPWRISYAGMHAAIPKWDRPEVDPENRSLWSLICSLVPRQRLASFRIHVVEGEGEALDEIHFSPFTWVDYEVDTINGGERIPANVNQVQIICSLDQSGEGAVKLSTVDKYDQIITRGARRRSVCTLSFTDDTLEAGWTAEQETEYEAGASAAAGYAAADLEDQRRLNHEARTREKLRNVFSRFAIPAAWDGFVLDGLGAGEPQSVFPDGSVPPGVFPQYPLELFIERTMPLLESVDYTGDKILLGTVDETEAGSEVKSELPPLVFWRWPLPNDRYSNIERLARDTPLTDETEEWNWSAHVTVPDEDRAIRLIVSGAPQHVLDYPGFARLADVDEELGQQDWGEMLVTCSITDVRYAEARHPPDTALLPTKEYIQRLTLHVGEKYRVDYVVPGTVVEIDEAGELVRSDGGYLHDDRSELEAIARVAWEFYSRTRRTLVLATDQLESVKALKIGDLVTAINQTDDDSSGTHHFLIGTPITEIRITATEGMPDAPPPTPRMRIVTDAGQFDALHFVAPEVHRKATHFPPTLAEGDFSRAAFDMLSRTYTMDARIARGH